MFEKVLTENGWIKQWEDEYGLYLFKNDTHLLLVYTWHNITRVNPIDNHDRWAIPQYEFDFVPYTQQDYEVIHDTIKN